MASSCPICAGGPLTHLRSHIDELTHQSYQLYACANCLVQHWQPLVGGGSDYYEDEGQPMYAAIHASTRPRKDVRFQRFLRDFGGRLTGPLLDVGCSDGMFMEAVARNGNEVWGVDFDSKALALARGRGLPNLYCGSIEDFLLQCEQEKRRFAVITLFDVLEHLANPIRALNQLSGLLSDGGKLVATVPNRDRLFANRISSDFPPHHFFRFNEQAVGRMLKHAGLQMLAIETFQFGYSVPAWIKATRDQLRRLGRRPVGPNEHSQKPGQRRPQSTARIRRGALVSNLVGAITAPLSYSLELPRRRGFKLYFVATRSGRSHGL